ncbi:hypothetical protein JB92DRAFT_2734866 [Gautieria morchelliformis]|nr:hypothetical protein JB92DRAFT_2734866 [Gautieria morchelliformis]
MLHRFVFRRVRTYSTVSPRASIYISTSTSPHFNLAVEDWLFRKALPDRPLLLLFKNEPCVVIGRNQNPWKEINFPALRALGVPFIRRRSGGGTVYHASDLGNTNFSIHLPRAAFNRHHTARIIQRALVSLSIDADVNERNDICVGGFKMMLIRGSKYVSGSAYKIVNKRAYHHGTMLISTELGRLGSLLHNTKDTMVTKGVASVRSPVHNLRQFRSNVTHARFMEAVIDNFTEEYEINPEVQMVHDGAEIRDIDHIKAGIIELQQWDWQYGQTPEFTHRLTGSFAWGEITADIRSKHGIILSCGVSSNSIDETWCKEFGSSLVGAKYASLEGMEREDLVENRRERLDILEWLREEM